MIESINLSNEIAGVLNENSGKFSKPFVACAMICPDFELSELKELKVAVVASGVNITNKTRELKQYEHIIDVGVWQKIDGQVEVEAPDICKVVSELVDFLISKQVVGSAILKEIKNDPIYSPENLRENRVFTSIITLKYLELK